MLFPGASVSFTWQFRLKQSNERLSPLQLGFSTRFGCAEIAETMDSVHCYSTLIILPKQHSVLDVIGSVPACEGDTVTLDAGSGHDAYSWNTGETTRSIRVTQSGQYYCTLTQSAEPHCLAYSDTVNLLFYPLPAKPTVVLSSDTLTASAATTWQWLRDGATIPGATGHRHIATENGMYAVRITDAHGCSAVSDQVKVTLVGVARLAPAGFTLAVYPNPSRDVFTVDVSTSRSVPVDVRVTDILGRTVYTRRVAEGSGHRTLSVDLSTHPSGVYYLHASGGGEHHARRLLLNAQ